MRLPDIPFRSKSTTRRCCPCRRQSAGRSCRCAGPAARSAPSHGNHNPEWIVQDRAGVIGRARAQRQRPTGTPWRRWSEAGGIAAHSTFKNGSTSCGMRQYWFRFPELNRLGHEIDRGDPQSRVICSCQAACDCGSVRAMTTEQSNVAERAARANGKTGEKLIPQASGVRGFGRACGPARRLWGRRRG